ncbi:MAG TPA: ABC transporter ATP-binding protein [Vicinamibacterales bacterium]|nr:ABC transporter ATP-binding protein [Vicinamibacterales bacterium]
MLSAIDVTFAYAPRRRAGRHGRPAVERATLTVAPNARVGILGPNGSGKTTLLKLLAGVLRPDAGRITLNGRDLRTFSRAGLARRLAMVPQETHPAFEYTVLEIVLMGRYAHLGPFEMERPDDVRVAQECLEATGTIELQDRPLHTLSGGEKQRVVIASALAQATDLLLLDEPSSSLDLRYQLEIAELLLRLARERGSTLVLTTHDLNFAATVCDTLVLIRGGRIIAAGAPRDVLTPAHIRDLYGVEVRVHDDARDGRLVVVPVRPSEHRGDREGTGGTP